MIYYYFAMKLTMNIVSFFLLFLHIICYNLIRWDIMRKTLLFLICFVSLFVFKYTASAEILDCDSYLKNYSNLESKGLANPQIKWVCENPSIAECVNRNMSGDCANNCTNSFTGNGPTSNGCISCVSNKCLSASEKMFMDGLVNASNKDINNGLTSTQCVERLNQISSNEPANNYICQNPEIVS